MTRTPGQRFRKPLLYPPELRGQNYLAEPGSSAATDSVVNLHSPEANQKENGLEQLQLRTSQMRELRGTADLSGSFFCWSPTLPCRHWRRLPACRRDPEIGRAVRVPGEFLGSNHPLPPRDRVHFGVINYPVLSPVSGFGEAGMADSVYIVGSGENRAGLNVAGRIEGIRGGTREPEIGWRST